MDSAAPPRPDRPGNSRTAVGVTFFSLSKSALEALREALLAMIRAGKAPLYWAPFIVIGV